MKIRLLFTTILLFYITTIFAAPFKNVEKILMQPDGTELHCYASGDEFYSRLHDSEGYTIVQAENGFFVYATTDSQGNVIPTEYIAGKSNPKTLNLRPNIVIPQKEYLKKRAKMKVSPRSRDLVGLNHGVYNNLVVYIKFNGDDDFKSSQAKIDSMLNNNGYYDISMNNYFKKATYNKLSMESYCYPKSDGDKIIAYEDIYPRNYYRPYNQTTNPEGYKDEERGPREFALLKRAIDYISDEIPDTLNIDRNEDGFVDNVIFVVKGSAGDWSDLLWPHMWEIHGEEVYIGNKKVLGFNFQLETSKYFTVSTLCHEMAHSLGFPDLYHYKAEYDYLSPTGPWDLMCNNSNPPQHSATYMKYKYGTWIDEIPEIDYGTYTIEANSWEGGRRNCYKIPTSDPDQYYLVEYRNNDNIFEKGLPNGGLLIYRLDTRFNGCVEYDGNDVLDELYIFRPGGSYRHDGKINLATFSAEANQTAFNSTTDPIPFLNLNEKDEEINICNISAKGEKMSFSYLPKNSDIIPTNLVANVNKDKYVELKWDMVADADSYDIYRDGVLIADNVTENFYNEEYVNIEKGYHFYYVSSNSNGEKSFRSEKENVIIGDYCEYVFDMNCSCENGWHGGEIKLSFNNGMDDVYLSMYSGNNKKESVVVPAGVEMVMSWMSGWDDAECSFVVTCNGDEIYKSETLEEGVLATFIPEGHTSCVEPQNLIAEVEGCEVKLQWNSYVESDYYAVLRNDELIVDSITTNFYIDKTVSNSGTHVYTVVSRKDACMSSPSAPANATIMKYSQDIISLDAICDNDTVKLEWNISTDGSHTVNYDDGVYVTSVGSNSNVWGIKMPAKNIDIYKGAKLAAIEIFDAVEATYNFNIYNGEKPDNTTLIHSESFATKNTNEFVRFDLSKEVTIDVDKDLWLTAKSSSSNGNPIPCGKFVGIDYSNMIKIGATWKSASEYDMDYSWLIRLHVKQNDDFANDVTYNIYRQDELIASGLQSTTYMDCGVADGNVCYNVGVVYNNKNILYSDNICLAIEDTPDVEESYSYGVFPNPTKDYVRISKEEKIKNIKIYTIGGSLVFDESVDSNELEVDMRKFAEGIYLIQVVTETETKVYKVIRN